MSEKDSVRLWIKYKEPGSQFTSRYVIDNVIKTNLHPASVSRLLRELAYEGLIKRSKGSYKFSVWEVK